MRRRTKQFVINEYMIKAKGDTYKALKMAVEDLGRVGFCLSAGFVRAAPYGKMQPPHEEPPSVDIPEPDDAE